MRYSDPTKVSLLSLTLLISFAGILEAVNPRPLQAAGKTSELLTAQTTPSSSSFPAIQNLPPGTQIKIDGTVTMKAINQLLQQRFPQKYAGTELLVNYNGTDAALQGLLTSKVDLAAIGRPLTEAEQSQGLASLPVARPKIALIVGTDNPFSGSLTDAQFAKIFRGEITNWAEIGGSDRPLRFIDRPSRSETRLAFQEYPVFRPAPFQTGAKVKQLATEDLDQLVKELGNEGLSYALIDQVNNKVGVRVLTMYNTPPTDPRYPFSQPFSYAYKSANPTPAIQALLGYVTATENQQAIAEARVSETIASTTTLVPSSPNSTSPANPAKSSSPNTSGVVPNATSSPGGAIVPTPTANISATGLGTGNTPGVLNGTPTTLADSSGGTTNPTSGGPTGQNNREGGDGNLWWLLLLGLGLPFLLLWLVRKGKGIAKKPSILVLTPEPGQSARAYWEINPEKIQSLHKQGEKNLTLRLTDVTNINPEVTTPALVKQVECHLDQSLISFPIPEIDREYQAELGCTTTGGNWVSLAKSAPTYFPAAQSFLGGIGGPGIFTAMGSTAIGSSINTQSSSSATVSAPAPESIAPKLGVGQGSEGTIAPPAADETSTTTPQAILTDVKALDIPPTENSPLDTTPPESSGLEEPNLAIETLAVGTIAAGTLGAIATAKMSKTPANNAPESLTSTPISSSIVPPEELVTDLWADQEPAVVPEAIKDTETITNVEVDRSAIAASNPKDSLLDLAQSSGTLTSSAAALTENEATNLADSSDPNSQTSLTPPTSPTALMYLIDSDHPVDDALDGGLGGAIGEVALIVIANNQVEAIAPEFGINQIDKTQIYLDKHTLQEGYVYWVLAPEDQLFLKSQGGERMLLRIHDATDIDIDFVLPHGTQEYACGLEYYDRYVPIVIGDRAYADYIAELGYLTNTGIWLRLIRSLHTRFSWE